MDFSDWKSKVTLANLVSWSVGAITLIFSFSGGFDWMAPRLIDYLLGKQAAMGAWQAGHHLGSKAAISVLILWLFYLLAFSVQASVLLSERAPKADYRDELAEAIGVRFTRVHDYYDVQNEAGDCFVNLEADLVVADLAMSHVERKYGSSSATKRETVRMEVLVHPPEVLATAEHTPAASNPRVYHFRFVPPLSHTTSTTTVKVTEEVTRGVWMWLEDTPDDRVLGGRLESIGHLVNEPTDLLVLEILFPRNYTVSGDRQFKVRLGTTENPHVREEQRLLNDNALKVELDRSSRQKLRLTVRNPLMGLCYFLCWVPPHKKQHSSDISALVEHPR